MALVIDARENTGERRSLTKLSMYCCISFLIVARDLKAVSAKRRRFDRLGEGQCQLAKLARGESQDLSQYYHEWKCCSG
jgi:hypothetical protein